jgi:PKD repeat protein
MKKLYLIIALCLSFTTTIMAQNPPYCSAQFSYAQNGNTANFSPSSFIDSFHYQTHLWSFGDGVSSNTGYPSHTYSTCGTYVVLHVTNTYDWNQSIVCSDSFAMTITIQCPNSCNINASYTYSIDANNMVHFTNTSTSNQNIDSVFWNFGDGSYSMENNPTHQFTPGYHAICLSVQSFVSGAMCYDVFCDTIYISTPPPPCNLSANFSIQGNGNSFTFTNLSNAADSMMTFWNFGDSSFAYGNVVNHTYNQPGTFSVCMTISQANNCMADTCINIEWGAPRISNARIYSYPNPATDNSTINVTLLKASTIEVAVYNMQNKLIAKKNQPGTIGLNSVRMNMASWPKGIYNVAIFSNGEKLITRIEKL